MYQRQEILPAMALFQLILMLFGALRSVNSVRIKCSFIYSVFSYFLSFQKQSKIGGGENVNFSEPIKDSMLKLHFIKVNIFELFCRKFHFFSRTLVGLRQWSDSFPDGRKATQNVQLE